GTSTSIFVSVTEIILVAFIVLKFTPTLDLSVPNRLPVMVMTVPGIPLSGLRAVMEGTKEESSLLSSPLSPQETVKKDKVRNTSTKRNRFNLFPINNCVLFYLYCYSLWNNHF